MQNRAFFYLKFVILRPYSYHIYYDTTQYEYYDYKDDDGKVDRR